MEVIAAIALGIAAYNYIDSEPSQTETLQTQHEQTYGSPVTIHVSDNQPYVQWVFIDG